MSHAHQIEDPETMRRFVVAGRAVFTLVSEKTGTRFTFRVTLKKETKDFFFVSVLTGPQNYTYLGCIRGGTFVHDRKLRIGQDAPSRKAFAWFWGRIQKDMALDHCECWHEGRCGRCGRELTVPSSIEAGLGPTCAEAA